MDYKVGRYLEKFRGIHWESQLEKMVKLREAPPIAVQMVLDMVSLIYPKFESHWGQEVGERHAPLMVAQVVVVMENLK